MWIKICANTTLDDALAAAEFGADAVGFVFARSSRQVTIGQVAAISPHLPEGVERIGVFALDSPEETLSGEPAERQLDRIALASQEGHLTGVQLHRGFDLAFARELQQRLGPVFSIIPTAHWQAEEDASSAERVGAQLAAVAALRNPFRVLIDAQVGSSSGGLGVPFSWGGAASVLASQPTLKVIVAGGLRPSNVAQAIRDLRPFGVDVASGVEASPGKKDYGKLRAFMKAARGVST